MSIHFRRAALTAIAVTAMIGTPANADSPSETPPKPAASKPSAKALHALSPPKRKLHRKAAHARASLMTAGNRWFQHSGLWCTSNQVGSDLNIKATTMAGRELVRVQNWLYRWNGSAWSYVTATPDAYATGWNTVDFTSRWLYSNGAPGASPGSTFNIAWSGSYGVAQRISWIDRLSGREVDSDYAWVRYGATSFYYCTL